MSELEKKPKCNRSDCAGCRYGHCVILTDNKFETPKGEKRECPFFKTYAQAEEDKNRWEHHFLKKFGFMFVPERSESSNQGKILKKARTDRKQRLKHLSD